MAENLRVEWTGSYEQFGHEQPMEFKNMYMDLNGNIFGVGSNDLGDFQITGTWTPKGLEFIKTYYSSHIIFYTATTIDGKRFEGNWKIPDSCEGSFWVEIILPTWSGIYTNNKKETEISLDMQITPSAIFGIGRDDMGSFVTKGSYDEHFSAVSFTRSYLGQKMVNYNGVLMMTKNGRMVKGVWTIRDTDTYGNFELTEELKE